MQVIYFILAVILLIWWWPDSLMIINILFIIALLSSHSPSHNELDNQTSKNANYTPAKDDISYSLPQDYLETSWQQGKKIQAVINALKTLKGSNGYKIISRLYSFQINYLKKDNFYVSDLYDYILSAANKISNTAKRDFVKRECLSVMRIIEMLKDGVSADDIAHTIFPLKNDSGSSIQDEGQITQESIDTSANEQNDSQPNNGAKVEDPRGG